MTATAFASPPGLRSMPAIHTHSLAAYLDSVQQIPVLSRIEEVRLFQALQGNDDLEAAKKIILSHLRYVGYIARSYMGYGLSLEDLIQQGSIGLMKSVKKFRLDYQVRLVTFAVHWIKAEIHEYILKNWKIVKVATTKAQRKLFFNLRSARQRLGWFNHREVEQIAIDLKVKPEAVLEMELRLGVFDESFDGTDTDDEKPVAPVSYLTHGQVEDPAAVSEKNQLVSMQSAGLSQALQSLDDRARDIVESRWLAGEKTALKTLGEKYGISMERVRQIEKRAFMKMQPYLSATA